MRLDENEIESTSKISVGIKKSRPTRVEKSMRILKQNTFLLSNLQGSARDSIINEMCNSSDDGFSSSETESLSHGIFGIIRALRHS